MSSARIGSITLRAEFHFIVKGPVLYVSSRQTDTTLDLRLNTVAARAKE
jgi:hypothetical protein